MNLPLILQSLTIILAPFYILRGQLDLDFLNWFVGGVGISFIPYTLLEFLILLTVFITVVDFLLNKGRVRVLKTGLEIPIIFFLIAVVLAVFSSWNFMAGLGILKAYFIEPILFFYCLVYTISKNNRNYQYVINSLFVTALWMSVLGVIQKLTGNFTLAPHEIAQGRISALYNSANSLAMFIGPVAILGLAEFIKEKRVMHKYLYLGFFGLLTLVMFWTRSRGGLAGLLAGVLIFSLFLIVVKSRKLKKNWYFIPVIGVLIAFLGGFLFFRGIEFPSKPNYVRPYTEGDTLQIRLFLWTGTIHLLKDYPVFGAGLGGFKTLYTNQYRLPQYQEQFQYPHNILLTFWTETGLLGLLTFIILIGSAIFLVIKNLQNDQILGAAIIGGFGYILIHGMVDVPYFKNDLSLEFWILIALVCGLSIGVKGDRKR